MYFNIVICFFKNHLCSNIMNFFRPELMSQLKVLSTLLPAKNLVSIILSFILILLSFFFISMVLYLSIWKWASFKVLSTLLSAVKNLLSSFFCLFNIHRSLFTIYIQSFHSLALSLSFFLSLSLSIYLSLYLSIFPSVPLCLISLSLSPENSFFEGKLNV